MLSDLALWAEIDFERDIMESGQSQRNIGLALPAIHIRVKKDREPGRKLLSRVSVILDFLVFFAAVPFLTVYGLFVDINGGSAEFAHQISYLLAPVTILGIAASAGLRRKGYDIAACLAPFAGPVLLALHMLLIF